MTRVVRQHDASAANREYYERAENRLGLRPDEESDGEQYVQRPSLSWLVGQCREARLDPVCVCSHRQAASGSFPKSTLPVGGQFYVVAVAT
ncbi:MAG: hypothetical protein M3Q31_14910 [Actinomycetota bacterium]|nr:hypothetical protein [Actinomycetota bacterium]